MLTVHTVQPVQPFSLSPHVHVRRDKDSLHLLHRLHRGVAALRACARRVVALAVGCEELESPRQAHARGRNQVTDLKHPARVAEDRSTRSRGEARTSSRSSSLVSPRKLVAPWDFAGDRA